MPILFVVLYGLLSGFFDVLPVSSFAHQSVLQNLFGIDGPLHLYKFLVHLASLAALVFTCMPNITALLREHRIQSLPRRRTQGDRGVTYELRFIKTALFATAVSTVLMLLIERQSQALSMIGIFCVVNGVVVLVPEYLPYGNKTAKHMSRIDAIFFGLLGGLGVFPGISRIATVQCYASLRGVDRAKASNWALLTTIPSLVVLIFFELIGMFTDGVGTISFPMLLSFCFGAVLSFLGTFGGVTLIRFLSAKVGFVGFGYYSIGAGLLTFFLYLSV